MPIAEIYLPVAIIILVVGAVAFMISAAADRRQSGTLSIKSVYVALVTLVALSIVVSSVTVLLNLGFRTWVFEKADASFLQRGAPPSLESVVREKGIVDAPVASAPVATEMMLYKCEDTCQFTDVQKNLVPTWKENYSSWKNNDVLGSQRQRDAVGAISFLIVSLPLFLIYLRMFQKEGRQDEEMGRSRTVRATYFYLVSLSSLLMVVISAGFLINLGLRTWVFPKANFNPYQVTPLIAYTSERNVIQSIVNCKSKCGFTEDDATTASAWLADYDAWQKESQTGSNATDTQRQAATTFPVLLVGIPLFWYHWRTVRKESKERDVSKPVNPPTS